MQKVIHSLKARAAALWYRFNLFWNDNLPFVWQENDLSLPSLPLLKAHTHTRRTHSRTHAERERERERERHTHTHTHTDRQTDRQTGRQAGR